MICFVVMMLCGGAFCCEIVELFNYKLILYNEREMLNLTITDGSYPADIELTSISGSCQNQIVKPLPDQYFDDSFRNYKHVKQIRVPMTQSLSECVYYVTMKSRSACLVKLIAIFRLRPRVACERCDVTVDIDWAAEARARFAGTQKFSCDVENVMCRESSPPASSTVLTSVQNAESNNSRTIQIKLRNEDIFRNESTFVCQANTVTVQGRLIKNESETSTNDVYYNIDDEYNATCNGSNVHWILKTDDLQASIENKTFVKKLREDDDKTKLICVDISCEDFERNGTCYKKILNEVTFHVNNAVLRPYLVLASVALVTLLAFLALVWCSCRRTRTPLMDIARRPRMATPPPERPPRRQPYYSVPLEKPMLGLGLRRN